MYIYIYIYIFTHRGLVFEAEVRGLKSEMEDSVFRFPGLSEGFLEIPSGSSGIFKTKRSNILLSPKPKALGFRGLGV